MNQSNENCNRKPLIALWFLHRTTEQIAEASDEETRAHLMRLQRYYLGRARQYGVTVEQVSDSLEITHEHAAELMALGTDVF